MQALTQDSQTSCHLVGGAVRDALSLAPTPKDFDFVISERGAAAFLGRLSQSGGVLERGPLGSPRWYPPGASVSADIMIAEQFWNGLDRCAKVEDVLRQFDMTANAVAIDLRTWAVIDPIGGVSDARRRVIRVVRTDYPDTPVSEGSQLTWAGMLWIRLWHYAAKLAWEIDPATWVWMTTERTFAVQVEAFRMQLFEPDMSRFARFSSGAE